MYKFIQDNWFLKFRRNLIKKKIFVILPLAHAKAHFLTEAFFLKIFYGSILRDVKFGFLSQMKANIISCSNI